MLDVSTPRETVLVTSRGRFTQMGKQETRDNVVPIDWHMPVSLDSFAVSVAKTSLTYALIADAKVFVVNFVSPDFNDLVAKIGSVSGKTTNKFRKYDIATEEADAVECLRLKKAVAYLCCHVFQQIDVGQYVVFVAKVVTSRELVPDAKRLFHVKEDRFTTTI